MNGDDQDFHQSRAGVRALTGFYAHVLIYVVVNAVLVAINLLVSPLNLWFYWVIFLWGVGLAFHALDAFLIAPREQEEREFHRAWEEKKRRTG